MVLLKDESANDTCRGIFLDYFEDCGESCRPLWEECRVIAWGALVLLEGQDQKKRERERRLEKKKKTQLGKKEKGK